MQLPAQPRAALAFQPCQRGAGSGRVRRQRSTLVKIGPMQGPDMTRALLSMAECQLLTAGTWHDDWRLCAPEQLEGTLVGSGRHAWHCPPAARQRARAAMRRCHADPRGWRHPRPRQGTALDIGMCAVMYKAATSSRGRGCAWQGYLGGRAPVPHVACWGAGWRVTPSYPRH